MVVTSVAVAVLLRQYQDCLKIVIFVSQARPEDSRLGSKLTGFKNRLLRPSSAKVQQGLENSYRAGSGYLPDSALGPAGPSPSPLDSAYDFGALAEDRRAAGHEPSTLPAEHSGKASNVLQKHVRYCICAY